HAPPPLRIREQRPHQLCQHEDDECAEDPTPPVLERNDGSRDEPGRLALIGERYHLAPVRLRVGGAEITRPGVLRIAGGEIGGGGVHAAAPSRCAPAGIPGWGPTA